MGSGGSGNRWSTSSAAEDAQKIRNAEEAVQDKEFRSDLADYLKDQLKAFNDRDVDGTRDKLEELRDAIGVEGISTVFGGSVSKHTYVDGLSDIDSLVIVDGSELESDDPSALLAHFDRKIKQELPDCSVERGTIAITVEYPDKSEVQLLPAKKEGDQLKVPSWDGKDWSSISPDRFQAKLTQRNDELGGQLVPTIKLVKSINQNLPEKLQLSGYHIESMAIEAFKGYDGSRDHGTLVQHFFDSAPDIVMQPIRDSSGQSVNVDDYLGDTGSKARQNANGMLKRISKRIRNANAKGSMNDWDNLVNPND